MTTVKFILLSRHHFNYFKTICHFSCINPHFHIVKVFALYNTMVKKINCVVFFFFLIFSYQVLGDEPDTLYCFDSSQDNSSELLSLLKHVLPKKQRIYTNYSIEQGIDGPYLRALSSATGSWLELDVQHIDVAKYPMMAWEWRVDIFPDIEWEMNPLNDDFAIRIELVYDFKGSRLNIFNIIKKGLITSIFRHYPPELIISYVWSLNVPAENPYQSPESKRMMILPIESDVALQGRWIHERRNINNDLISFKGKTHHLFLKKIRIRSDTDNKPTIAESGLKYIYLIGRNLDDDR